MSSPFQLIAIIWTTVLVISAFLVIFIAPIEIVIFNNRTDMYITSFVQASIAVVIVGLLIIFLSYLKKVYVQKKLSL